LGEALLGTGRLPIPIAALALEPAVLPVGSELFRKAVWELVDNGLKFSDSRHPVKVTGAREDGAYRLRVEDRGLGMRKDQIANLAPFTQFDRTEFEQQGVGLGLGLVHLAADILGISFDLSSKLAEGTCATLWVPL